jgi:hypothetical protein
MEKLPDILGLPRFRRSEHTPAACSGIYGLFLAPNGTLPLIEPEHDGLIYIGKAEGTDGFVGRCHFDGARTLNHSPSKSLAGLLKDALNLELLRHPPKKWGLTLESDRALTSWMHKNLLVAYFESSQSLSIERSLIKAYAPPLNLTICAKSHQHFIVKRFRDSAKAMALTSNSKEYG